MCADRKDTEEKRSSSGSVKDKPSDGNGTAAPQASSDAEPMESEPAPPASSPKLNGQQELLHSEGDTQSN